MVCSTACPCVRLEGGRDPLCPVWEAWRPQAGAWPEERGSCQMGSTWISVATPPFASPLPCTSLWRCSRSDVDEELKLLAGTGASLPPPPCPIPVHLHCDLPRLPLRCLGWGWWVLATGFPLQDALGHWWGGSVGAQGLPRPHLSLAVSQIKAKVTPGLPCGGTFQLLTPHVGPDCVKSDTLSLPKVTQGLEPSLPAGRAGSGPPRPLCSGTLTPVLSLQPFCFCLAGALVLTLLSCLHSHVLFGKHLLVGCVFFFFLLYSFFFGHEYLSFCNQPQDEGASPPLPGLT